MRLIHIKLSGFKSFVDPVTISIPSQLVGVVGPNGCGKSNIMDAVRWVLGESKASELRGSSMQDVIFNGSKERKPSARASVELIFDNSDGRFLGQWQSYSEVSVKRILGRDGQSQYLINQQQVRRKDVHDLFLGTGLGSKGYAMIGQGMINRFLEAKPEELRIYLEEAAGVSRYKQRRKETQSRLQDTRENLTRLEDILLELDRQLEHLQGQADLARKYRQLQASGEKAQYLFWYLNEKKSQEKEAQKQKSLKQLSEQLSHLEDCIRQIDIDYQGQQNKVNDSGDSLHIGQKMLYQSQLTITRLQTQQQHTAQMIERMRFQIDQLKEKKVQWSDQLEYVSEHFAELDVEREIKQAQLEDMQALISPVLDDLSEKEVILSQEQIFLKEECSILEKLQRNILVFSHQVQSLGERLKQLENQIQHKREQKQALVSPSKQDLYGLELQLAQVLDELKEVNAQQKQWDEDNESQKVKIETIELQYREQQNAVQEIQAKYKVLSDIQIRSENQALSQGEFLSDKQPLWHFIRVQTGWERALENVMRERLSGIEVNSLEEVLSLPIKNRQSSIAFFEQSAIYQQSDTPWSNLKAKLSFESKEVEGFVSFYLKDVFCVDSLEKALEQRKELPQGGCFVTPLGYCVDAHSISLYVPNSEEYGQLERKNQLIALESQLLTEQAVSQEIADRLEEEKAYLSELLSTESILKEKAYDLTDKKHHLELKIQALNLSIEQFNENQLFIEDHLKQLNQEYEQVSLEKARVEELILQEEVFVESQQVKVNSKEQGLTQLLNLLEEKKAYLQSLEKQVQALQMELFHVQDKYQSYEQQKSLAQTQLLQIGTELERLEEDLQSVNILDLDRELQEALEQRVIYQEKVDELTRVLESHQALLQDISEQKMQLEQKKQPLIDQKMQLQLDLQAAKLSLEQYASQLDQLSITREAIEVELGGLTEQQRSLSYLQSEIHRINRGINELGNVNLAAIDELEATSERATFLKQQSQDLIEAINTLEEAIRKIDRQTRALLKETFDQVNIHFSSLFPQLFGGGYAELMMTGEEILESGVQIMAQPPGKKNASISLLSGGEKTLTAIALVFALFKLNPAPFCLLDEVDAPLDDSNTERFTHMVECMTDQTQFLFISHNKIAMQMAQHLIGVTMQEKGVSRIVSVDMQAALKLNNLE